MLDLLPSARAFHVLELVLKVPLPSSLHTIKTSPAALIAETDDKTPVQRRQN
jgi:hypothetical protein